MFLRVVEVFINYVVCSIIAFQNHACLNVDFSQLGNQGFYQNPHLIYPLNPNWLSKYVKVILHHNLETQAYIKAVASSASGLKSKIGCGAHSFD